MSAVQTTSAQTAAARFRSALERVPGSEIEVRDAQPAAGQVTVK